MIQTEFFIHFKNKLRSMTKIKISNQNAQIHTILLDNQALFLMNESLHYDD